MSIDVRFHFFVFNLFFDASSLSFLNKVIKILIVKTRIKGIPHILRRSFLFYVIDHTFEIRYHIHLKKLNSKDSTAISIEQNTKKRITLIHIFWIEFEDVNKYNSKRIKTKHRCKY